MCEPGVTQQASTSWNLQNFQWVRNVPGTRQFLNELLHDLGFVAVLLFCLIGNTAFFWNRWTNSWFSTFFHAWGNWIWLHTTRTYYQKHIFVVWISKYCFAGGKCCLSCNTFENTCALWHARCVIVSTRRVCRLEHAYGDAEVLKILIVQDMEISSVK